MALGTRKIPDPMTEPMMRRIRSPRRRLCASLVMPGAKDICNALQAQLFAEGAKTTDSSCLSSPGRRNDKELGRFNKVKGAACAASLKVKSRGQEWPRHTN